MFASFITLLILFFIIKYILAWIDYFNKLDDRLGNLLASKADEDSKAEALRKEIISAEKQVTVLQSTVNDITVKLKEAKADRHESSRVRKLNDAVDAMQRLIPGVHGKLIDLCKPTSVIFYTHLFLTRTNTS